jgi:hypothetical protein
MLEIVESRKIRCTRKEVHSVIVSAAFELLLSPVRQVAGAELLMVSHFGDRFAHGKDIV